MHRRPLTLTALVCVAAIGCAGCGVTNPYQATSQPADPPPTATPATGTGTDPTPIQERGGTVPANAASAAHHLDSGAGSGTPAAALSAYADLYINWTARTVAGVQTRLAGMSLGGARSQALQAAASYGHDSTLQQSHVTNQGQIIAIAPDQGRNQGGWVVVTREQTRGDGDYAGLPATVHVYLAHLTRTAAGWVIDQWQPQS